MLNIIQSLTNKKISEIVFTDTDSISLKIEGHKLTYYQWPQLTVDGVEYNDDMPGYNEAFMSFVEGMINKVLYEESEYLRIFAGENSIVLMLQEDEDSFYFRDKDGEWMAN